MTQNPTLSDRSSASVLNLPSPDGEGELDALPPIPGIAPRDGFSFRRGQHLFLLRLAEALGRGERNHLGVLVPGYGKTISALAAFAVAYRLGAAKKLVVFVPRGNLRDQYADPAELSRVFHSIGAPPFSFCVADTERAFLKNIDTTIIITTYQYASGRGGHAALKRFCASAPCMFVFDEVHHLSDDGLWAERIAEFPFACSVSLSGTPMRSDNKTLFGVPFEIGPDGNNYYVALHEVSMREAHAEGKILKGVQAHVIDYRLRMIRSDTGEEVQLSLSQLADEVGTSKSEIDAYLARRKLRFHEVYLESLLAPAFECFRDKRRAHRAAGGGARNHQMLIIAMSNLHAQAILEFVRERFPDASSARIGQDVPAQEREALLDDYRSGRLEVMVQVDMIGEGTDIKPISVIVKADLVRAWSKTMQQIFRGMRWFGGFDEAGNVCDIFTANDAELVAILEWMTSEERLGMAIRTRREVVEREAAVQRESVWELTDVQERGRATHTLELFPEYADDHRNEEAERRAAALKPVPAPEPPPVPVNVVDVRRREAELRTTCATLAQRLVQTLRGRGMNLEVSWVHAEAIKRLRRTQGELSLRELEWKKEWLERCLAARRIL